MGDYTQYRGHLHLGSVASERRPSYGALRKKFNEMQAKFCASGIERAGVCYDTHITSNSNGSIWIFVGSEHKDYAGTMNAWLMNLAKEFYCEGRIEVQDSLAPLVQDVMHFNGHTVTIEKARRARVKGYGF